MELQGRGPSFGGWHEHEGSLRTPYHRWSCRDCQRRLLRWNRLCASRRWASVTWV
ncbi:hypothetical protein HY634_02560 [Candidatus Uhrbacteria bacterium]|nr:hypothetical protein [Candidatus Uhrbacteria bacterium]